MAGAGDEHPCGVVANGVAELIFGLADEDEMSVVVVTHDSVIADRAEQVVSLRNGHVVAAS